MNQIYSNNKYRYHSILRNMNIIVQVGGGIKTIYLIRHGESEHNKMGVIQGDDIESNLTSLGKEQAKKTGQYLKQHLNGKSIIYHSPMPRAIETADIINEYLSIDNIKSNDLKELGTGKLAGLTKDNPFIEVLKEINKRITAAKLPTIESEYRFAQEQLEKIPPDELKKYGFDNGIIGVEDADHVTARINRIIEIIKNIRGYDNILIISHSSLLDYLSKVMLNTNHISYDKLTHGKNCYISIIEYSNSEFKHISPPSTYHLAELSH